MHVLALATALADVSPSPAASPVPEATGAPVVAVPAAARDRAGYTYAYALHTSRYDDTILSIDTYKPFGNRDARVRPFVDVAYVRDSRTQGGDVPIIFSDNYVLGALGLQYTDGRGLRLFAQGGTTATIGPVAALPAGGDVRGGAQYYREWGVQKPHAGYGTFYGSTTYYSRYKDAVLYAQSEQAVNVANAAAPLEPFVREVVTLDSRGFYYDTLAELTAGLRYRPFGPRGPILSVEGAAGTYFGGTLPPKSARTYTDLRPTVSYGFSL